MIVQRFLRLLVSGALALLATKGFIKAVNASPDWSLLLLFAGFWIGIHAFLGFVRFSQRLDRVARLNLLSAEDYERISQSSLDGSERSDSADHSR